MVPGLAALKEKLNLKSFPTWFLIFIFFILRLSLS